MAATAKTTPTKTTPKKRRKTERKALTVPVRMTASQKESLARIAARDGVGLSTWLLMLGLRSARDLDP